MPKQYPFALKTPFCPGLEPALPISGAALWFTFCREMILLQSIDRDTVAVTDRAPEHFGLPAAFARYLGRHGTTDCFVAELAEPPDGCEAPAGMQFRGLRSLYGTMDEDLFILAGRALQIVHWHREHRFCGRCGTAMADRSDELARECPNCGLISHPRLSPAVIMAVLREDKILLARSPRFPAGMYSTLAGFVEPGEILEEAVAREVWEETAIEVDDIRYVASQPWPFPHSLMIGFAARYAGGEIRIDGREIEAADWFGADDLPPLPSKVSIARLLIDNFIKATAGAGS